MATTTDTHESQFTGWSFVRPNEHGLNRINEIKNILRPAIPDGFKEETDPHVTIIPTFSLPSSNASQLLESLEPDPITPVNKRVCYVTGLDFYPGLNMLADPFVVKLNVRFPFDISNVRNEYISRIKSMGGQIIYEPVTPHITLFKGGDKGESPNRLNHEDIDAIMKASKNISPPPLFTCSFDGVIVTES